jgi:hypothetical protein
MRAEELRIGNWFKEDTLEPKFAQITAEQILDLYDDPLDDFYQPIPITVEWLLKLGFEKEKSDIPTFSKVFGLFIEDDYEHCLIINLDADENFYTVFNGVKLILKHVNQLQNLYFALTGEELI